LEKQDNSKVEHLVGNIDTMDSRDSQERFVGTLNIKIQISQNS
jgi:hypothetical protein